MSERTAVVTGARTADEVARYLPDNYRVLYAVTRDGVFEVVIRGTDNAGWTLDGYVAPRLASGLMWAKEDGWPEGHPHATPSHAGPHLG